MDFDFTAEDEAFRTELRAFLDEELPEWWKTVFVDDARAMPFTRELCQKLAARGWLTMSWLYVVGFFIGTRRLESHRRW